MSPSGMMGSKRLWTRSGTVTRHTSDSITLSQPQAVVGDLDCAVVDVLLHLFYCHGLVLAASKGSYGLKGRPPPAGRRSRAGHLYLDSFKNTADESSACYAQDWLKLASGQGGRN